MKNKTFYTILTGLLMSGGILATLHFTSNSASAYLSQEEAEAKISSQFSGEIVELELEQEGKTKIYEVEIQGSKFVYELKLDAETGEILKLEEKTVASNNNGTVEQSTEATVEANNENTESEERDGQEANESETVALENNTNTDQKTTVKGDDRSTTASSSTNQETTSTTDSNSSNTESETNHHTQVNDSSSQNEEDTTEDRNKENENREENDDSDGREDNDQVKQETNAQATLISETKAKDIALSQAVGTIGEIKLDEDDGEMYYEIEIETVIEEVDIEIDAYTGAIISISKD